MANSGRTVLVFLGACLVLAEAGVVVIAALTNPNGNLVAGFALLALGMVLLTLAYMYRINPGFLTIRGQDASGLAILQTIASTRPDLITPEYILSLASANLTLGESARVDEAAGASDQAKEAAELEQELQRARRASSGIRMSFVEQLKWRQDFEDFSPEQQKVLLALSDSRYLWRTLDRLESVTSLHSRALTDAINDLIAKGLIRASVSRVRKEPVFGLVERVAEGRPMRPAR